MCAIAPDPYSKSETASGQPDAGNPHVRLCEGQQANPSQQNDRPDFIIGYKKGEP